MSQQLKKVKKRTKGVFLNSTKWFTLHQLADLFIPITTRLRYEAFSLAAIIAISSHI